MAGRGAARRAAGDGYHPQRCAVGPVDDVMVSALTFAAFPVPARAASLRRALARVRQGLSPKLDNVIDLAGRALDQPGDQSTRQALIGAAKDLAGVRIAPGQQKWWEG